MNENNAGSRPSPSFIPYKSFFILIGVNQNGNSSIFSSSLIHSLHTPSLLTTLILFLPQERISVFNVIGVFTSTLLVSGVLVLNQKCPPLVVFIILVLIFLSLIISQSTLK